MDEQEQLLYYYEEPVKEKYPRMSQFTAIICQGCHKGIRAHHGKEAGVFELSPGPNGLPIKRGWHTRRCWPMERKRRRKEQRQETAWKQKQTLADLEAETAFRISKELDSKMMKENEVPPPLPEPPADKPGGFKGVRGVGLAVYEIMDAIPPGQEWTQHEVAAQLQRAGFTTTYETVQQLSYIYRKQRRAAHKTRQDGATRVFMFDEPAPAEPPEITTQNSQMRKAAPDRKKLEQQRVVVKEQIKELDEEIKKVDEEIKQAGPPTARPLPKPAPTPSLSNAEINRAFNDFQAFMLEALMDFRNELLKMRK
jgi:hypothetical protein